MTSQEIIRLSDESVLPTYARFPVAFASGKGATLRDAEGKEYIDFSSGIGVNSLGYGNEKWVHAVSAQAATLAHVSNLYYTEPYARLAAELKNRTGMSRVFFANSGAEANEGIIKLARKYAFDKLGPGHSNIVTLVNSFHGRTVTTLKATGQERFHNYFFPFTEGFTYAEAENIESVKQAAGDHSCAILMELVQGEGGVHALEQSFVDKAAELCEKNDILFIDDEVQVGIGRSGTLFAFEQYGIKPDIVSFAKGIGAGLPIGGIICGPKTCDVLVPGDHGSTFGMNPVACAGANVVLDTIDDAFLSAVKVKSRFIREELASMKKVTGLDGLGLMIGIDLEGMTGAEATARLLEEGVLTIPAGDRLRLLPPLTISLEETCKALAAIRRVLD